VSFFIDQAGLLVSRLEVESASGARNSSIDGDLSALRRSWTQLEASDSESVAESTARIAALV